MEREELTRVICRWTPPRGTPYRRFMILGAHCSTAGGVHTALERAKSIGAASCQIFVKNNMQWFGQPYSQKELARYAGQAALSRIAPVFGHAGYLINLAGPAGANRDKSLQSLIQEIELATQLGLPFLVLHPGSRLGLGEATGINQVAAGLDQVLHATRRSRVRLALENTAGQGTCLGHRLEHLAAVYDAVSQPARLGVCLDTAHLFEAGFDLRTRSGWNRIIKELDALLGLKEVLAFHLNDSKTPLGSRVDRHAGIGEGQIGREAFRHVVNDPRFRDLPGCLETPKSADLHEDRENLAMLRALER
jgi:deoxyribonuclease IV